jgi:hypothetical protein
MVRLFLSQEKALQSFRPGARPTRCGWPAKPFWPPFALHLFLLQPCRAGHGNCHLALGNKDQDALLINTAILLIFIDVF